MKITNNDWETLEILWRYLRVNSSLPNQADVIIVGGAGLVTEMAIYPLEKNEKNHSISTSHS